MLKTIHKIFWIITIFSFSLSFNSCSQQPANEVAGTYSGDLGISVMGESISNGVAEVTLTCTDDDKVTIAIPALSNGDEMALPAMNIENVIVKSKKTGGYKLEETPININTDDLTITGTISGVLIDGKLILNGAIKPGEMPMNIDINFSTKQ